MSYVRRYKMKDFFNSPKFANTVSVFSLAVAVTLAIFLCKGCNVTNTDRKSSKEIAGLKKEFAEEMGGLEKEVADLKLANAQLLQIVDSCCCDCNKKEQNVVAKPKTVVKPKPVVQPVQPKPVVVRDTVIKVVRDTVIKVVRDTVAIEPQPAPVDTVDKKAKTQGFQIAVYMVDSKRKRR